MSTYKRLYVEKFTSTMRDGISFLKAINFH